MRYDELLEQFVLQPTGFTVLESTTTLLQLQLSILPSVDGLLPFYSKTVDRRGRFGACRDLEAIGQAFAGEHQRGHYQRHNNAGSPSGLELVSYLLQHPNALNLTA